MEDFHRAGGLLAVLREVRDLLDPAALTVTGRPLVSYLDDAPIWDPEVIRGRAAPLLPDAGIAVLYGNLAPNGAVIKPAAASPELLTHRGRAVVFDTIEDMHARIDDPALDVDADSVLVLRGCGPKGYPGMPEVANMPLPTKLLAAGCSGHGPGLRRADERYRLRHRGAARGAGGRGRWAVGTGPDRRPHHPRRAQSAARRRPPGRRTRGPDAERGDHRRLRQARAAAGSSCMSTTSCRPTPGPTWISCSAPAATRCPVNPTESSGRLVDARPKPHQESACF